MTGDLHIDELTASDSLIQGPVASISDDTPPADIAYVNDGTGADTDTASADHLSANWAASDDPDSGIIGYLYAIGTNPGWTDVVGWTNNGTATAVTRTGLSLTNGVRYYFSVKAVNGGWLEGNAANSDGAVASGGTEPYRQPGEEVQVRTYPNPLMTSRESQMQFATNEANGGEIKIYSISGKLISTISITPGNTQASWDLNNTSGNTVKNGVYIYAITDSEGKVKTGKVAITK